MLSQTHIEPAAKKVKDSFKQIQISDLLAHKRETSFKPLISFLETTSIKDLLEALAADDILAAPIYRLEGESRVYTGIISVYDILSFAVFEEIFDSETDFNASNLFDFLKRINPVEFFNMPVAKVVGSSDDSVAPWILYSSNSLMDLVNIFDKANQHRALIVDAEILQLSLSGGLIPANASVTIVSQNDMVKYINESKFGKTKLDGKLLEPLLDLTVADLDAMLKPKSRPVVAMLESQSALHGFRTMFLEGLQGLPVIDTKGNIAANLSSSDMRGLTIENMDKLASPVFTYLEATARKGSLSIDQIRTVAHSATVEKAIDTLLKNRIHRLWITQDDSDKLYGCLSITDFLLLFK
jgi:CBS domain-containing protein